MPRLLHHHDRLLARPDRRHLRRLLDRAVPADGREGAIDGRVLVQAEVGGGREDEGEGEGNMIERVEAVVSCYRW